MKKWNRIISAVLTVCMLLSMAVPIALAADEAATKTYDLGYDYKNTSGNNKVYDDIVDSPDGDWEYVNRGGEKAATVTIADANGVSMNGNMVGQWLAIRIKNIDAAVGYNTLKITIIPFSMGGIYEVYLLPGATDNTDEAIEAALSTPVAKKENVDTLTGGTVTFENLSLTEESYMLVFRVSELNTANGAGRIRVYQAELSVQEQPAAELVSVQATPSANNVEVGKTVSITAKAYMTDNTEASAATFTYESLTTDIASVDAEGVVTGVAVGTAQIKVTATLDGKTVESTVSLTVQEQAAAPVSKKYSLQIAYDNGTGTNTNRPPDDKCPVDFPDNDWEFVKRGGVSLATVTITEANGVTMNGSKEGQWFAIRINDVDKTAGYNALKVNIAGFSAGGVYDIFILPGSTGNTDEAIEAALSAPLAKKENVDTVTGGTVTLSNLNLNDESYMLVFQCKSGRIRVPWVELSVLEPLELSAVQLTALKDELKVGETLSLTVKAYLTDNSEANGVTYTYESLTPDTASVDANGVVFGKAVGAAQIKVTARLGDKEVSDTMDLNVAVTTTDSSGVKSAMLDLPASIYVNETAEATLRVTLNSGYETIIPAGDISFATSDDTVASIDANGVVTAKAQGSVVLTATATYMGQTVSAQATVTAVASRKTEPSYYTYEKRANALKNIELYDWAKEMRDTAVAAADSYLESIEALYNSIMPEGLPRSRQLHLQKSNSITDCQNCGCNIYSTHGNMLLNVIEKPWKVQCPECQMYFPTNDFESFYKLGLDENGAFDYELAHQKNAELVAAGETGYLVNILYPEKGETWGVDDGYGFRVYTDGSYGVMGTTADTYKVKLYEAGYSGADMEQTSLYIAYYVYKYWSDLQSVLTTLAEAYLYTGEAKYGHAGAILLDRVADVYPSYDLQLYAASRNDFQVTDGNSGHGKVFGRINDASLARSLAEVCDAFFPAIADEKVLSFLSEKKNTEYTEASLWQNWRNNILLEIYNGVYKGQVKGNYGQPQAAVAAAAIVLNEEPETTKMIEWIYTPNPDVNRNVVPQIGGNLASQLIDVVDRDGFGNEAAPNYNSSWIERLIGMAEYLAMYKGEKDYNPYENPKFVQMVVAHASLVSLDYFTAQIGDSGSTANMGFTRASGVTDVAFKYLKDTSVGKQLADYIYTWNGGDLSTLSYGIFDADPESIRADIMELVGDGKEQTSEMLPSYGFSILRDGQTGQEKTLRDYWMTYGITSGHGHADALSIGIGAFGLNVAPDLGYPTNTGTLPVRLQWESATISHNTVTVDLDSQDEVNSFATHDPYLFDDSDTVKVMGVDASGAYEQTDIYNRTVVMVKVNDEISYGVDFFRVLGGSNHTFSFHTQSHNVTAAEGLEMTAQVDADGNYVGTYAGADVAFGKDPNSPASWYYETFYPRGYTWLTNVRKDTAVGSSFAVDFAITDYKGAVEDSENLHMYMTQINNFDADEVAFVAGPVPQRSGNALITELTDTLDYVLVQRKAEAGQTLDSLFTTIYEPYQSERYLKSIESVPVTVVSGTPSATETAMAVKVTHENGRVDYVFYASNNEVTYRVANLFNVRGYIGYYSLDVNGGELYRYVADGDIIVDATNTESVYTGTVTGFSKDLTLEGNYIDVDLALDGAAMEKLVGRYIHVTTDGVQNGIYAITGAEAIEGGTRLSTGTITLIRSHIDPLNVNGGYIYNIAEGQSFEIPLSYMSAHTCSGGTANCAEPAVCLCGQHHGEKNPNNHIGGTELRNAAEATAAENGYTGDTHCKGCGVLLQAGTVIPALNQVAADDVKAKINAIGTVTLESKTDIDIARAAYDALTEDQKALVTNLSTLTEAEAKYDQLKEAAGQAAADKAAADAVAEKIETIGTVTLESQEAIKAAREAYDALTAEQKALVSNLDALTAAEAKLAELQAAAADAERIEAARDVVGKALAAMTITNDTSKEAIQKTIDEALKKAGITDAEAAVTDVTVTAATIEKAGSATITVVIASGKGSESTVHTKTIAKLIPPADPQNPQTGDEADVLLLVLLMVISVMGIAAVVICAPKFSYKGKHLK